MEIFILLLLLMGNILFAVKNYLEDKKIAMAFSAYASGFVSFAIFALIR